MAHIGIDARITAYRVGGISTYARRLIHALEDVEHDHQLTVFRSRKPDTGLTRRFNTAQLFTPAHHRLERTALSLELRRFKLDLLHSVDFIPPRHGAGRHVITVHDLTFLRYPEHKDRAALRYYSDQIVEAVSHADHILSVSRATKTDLIDLLGVPQDKITVQPHGVEARFRPMSEDEIAPWRKRLTLPDRFLLFVGTLEPRKNIPTLLDAYALLDDPPPLLLVGQIGWLFDATMKRIQTMQEDGLPIHHRTDIDDDALPALYNAAHMLILPSHYEGFGLPILEAMACGTPVIASNTSALPEVLGNAGALIDPDNPEMLAAAMHFALSHDEWRKRASKRGLERARTFTWDNAARIAQFVYRSLL